ncbi:pentapeptide repeat-containing protein, partial [Candidatus Marinamargulisbacteria bacterium]|nr:pentapeptide repeat-containing protein [Candidatus Marinamargulisbacteria bacterium]
MAIRTLTALAATTALANTGLANTGLANTGLANTGLANTGLANTGLANTGLANTGSAANTATFNFIPNLRGASYTNSNSSDNLRTLSNITEPPVKLWEVNSVQGRLLSQETCAAGLTNLLISLQEATEDYAAIEYTNCVYSKYKLERNQAESVYSLLSNQFETAGVMNTINNYGDLLSNTVFVMTMAYAAESQSFADLVKSFTTTSITTTTTGTNTTVTVSTPNRCVNFNFNCGGELTPEQLAEVQDTCQELVYQNLSNDELNKKACAAVATITNSSITTTYTTATATGTTTSSITRTTTSSTTGTNSSTTVSVTVPTNDQCVNFNFTCEGELTTEQLAEVQDTCQELVYQNLSNYELNKKACAAVANITGPVTTTTVSSTNTGTGITENTTIVTKTNSSISTTYTNVTDTNSNTSTTSITVTNTNNGVSTTSTTVTNTNSNRSETSTNVSVPTNDQCVSVNFNFTCEGVLTPEQLAEVQDTCQELVHQNLSNDELNDELNKQACAAVANITGNPPV